MVAAAISKGFANITERASMSLWLYCYPQSPDEVAEAERGWTTCSVTHRGWWRQPDSRAQAWEETVAISVGGGVGGVGWVALS